MSTSVHAAIAKRFPSPEWVTLWEVRDDAGFRARRSADAVAINTWPSRGLQIVGVEVKVSRSDWLRELKDPEKSAPIQRYCDTWWVATIDETIAKVDEIPATWGLLVLDGKALRVAKHAPALQPEAPTLGFVATLLRNATKGLVPEAKVDEAVEEKLQRHVEMNRDHSARRAEENERELKALRTRVGEFEKASGLKVDGRYQYGNMGNPTKLGEAVRALIDDTFGLSLGTLEQAKNMVDRLSSEMSAAIEVMNALKGKKEAAAQ